MKAIPARVSGSCSSSLTFFEVKIKRQNDNTCRVSEMIDYLQLGVRRGSRGELQGWGEKKVSLNQKKRAILEALKMPLSCLNGRLLFEPTFNLLLLLIFTLGNRSMRPELQDVSRLW